MDLIGDVLILIGSIFVLLSAIGIVKMPDYLMKLQAASKASAFGIIIILIGGKFVYFNMIYLSSSIVIIIFLLLTTPIAAHALAKAEKRLKSNNYND